MTGRHEEGQLHATIDAILDADFIETQLYLDWETPKRKGADIYMSGFKDPLLLHWSVALTHHSLNRRKSPDRSHAESDHPSCFLFPCSHRSMPRLCQVTELMVQPLQ